MKKIGLLTSGGDAPGMNAAVRAVVRGAINNGIEVYGIRRGYMGLVEDDMYKMDMRSVSDIIQRGGTILYTARCEEMKTVEGQKKAVATIKRHGLDGVITIGGDGTFTGARILADKYKIPTIGIPGTIDNDLAYTDFTIGFDTAVNTVVDAINKLRDTMTSHDRVCVVEVMGRHCGDIALYSGISSGAEVIVVPEIPMSIEQVCDKLQENVQLGKLNGVIILAEGVDNAQNYCKLIKENVKVKVSVRPTVLGHIQRGGAPSMADRVLASRLGYRAVELISEGVGNRVVGVRDNKIFDEDIIEALARKSEFDKKLYDVADIISK